MVEFVFDSINFISAAKEFGNQETGDCYCDKHYDHLFINKPTGIIFSRNSKADASEF